MRGSKVDNLTPCGSCLYNLELRGSAADDLLGLFLDLLHSLLSCLDNGLEGVEDVGLAERRDDAFAVGKRDAGHLEAEARGCTGDYREQTFSEWTPPLGLQEETYSTKREK